MSKELFDKTMPVTPPTVNKNKNPKDQRRIGFQFVFLPNKDANQEKILIPVGTAIIIVADVK
jgi:acetone carboxylase gamma subunit